MFFFHPNSSVQISGLKLKAWIVNAKEAWDLFKQTDRAFFNASQSLLVLLYRRRLRFPPAIPGLVVVLTDEDKDPQGQGSPA
jgi:hypothetical protein